VLSQSLLSGLVSSNKEAIPYANVYLEGTQDGTFTDENGRFELATELTGDFTLIVSAVGFQQVQRDVSLPRSEYHLGELVLKEDALGLQEVVISGTMEETFVSMSPVKVDVVTEKFLRNTISPTNLVEAIAMVNGVQEVVACGVCYTNSISINGLPGQYTAVLVDGSPIYGNLASVYGLNGIPTQLIDRFEVIKGPSSTLYGSEAMAGVINIITKDPAEQPKLSIDLMATSHLESFGNIAFSGKAGKFNTSSGINYAYINDFVDRNGDGFGDVAAMDRLSLFSKWSMQRKSGKKFTIAGKAYFEDRRNGLEQYMSDRNYREIRGNDSIYGESIYTDRYELFGTYEFNSSQHLQLDYSLSSHNQDSYYGADRYKAKQHIAFTNLLWRKQFGSHRILGGLTNRWQYYDDNTVATEDFNGDNRPDNQYIPGVFAQDEWTISDKLTLLPGMRLDYYDSHGLISSPRLSLKFNPAPFTTFRINSGTGFKIVNLFTEDHAFITGQREVVIEEELLPEQSYTISSNLNHVYTVGESQGMADIDIFYTHFTNKILPDYETPGQIIYANSDGDVTTFGISASVTHQFTFPLSLKMGLNFQDVQQQERGDNGDFESRPVEYSTAWSGLGTANYKFKRLGLNLAYTLRFNGPMYLPEVFDLDNQGQLLPIARSRYSAPFSVHNIQITKDFSSDLSIYLGVSNIFDYIQPITPLTGFNDPTTAPGFSDFFDTSYNFAPLNGREIYLGVRFSVN